MSALQPLEFKAAEANLWIVILDKVTLMDLTVFSLHFWTTTVESNQHLTKPTVPQSTATLQYNKVNFQHASSETGAVMVICAMYLCQC